MVHQRPNREFRPVFDPELPVDFVQILFDGSLSEMQVIGDLFVQFCLTHQIHHLFFPKRQVGTEGFLIAPFGLAAG